ncbi:MAG: hypothetical protein NC097_02620 [Clostridium sp.]|nr:hypothetical protein [Prevotella sp.]MCM1428670.1 hypothetical protein [Clostridium sp.]MCM1475799.1 hypothetical protein [Muribaculaceae bacterium]
MIPQLLNKDIYIGRNPENNRPNLRVAVVDPSGRSLACVCSLQVPENVSRCIEGQRTAHLILRIDAYGRMTLINAKQNNKTFVDSREVQQSLITDHSRVNLSNASGYRLDIPYVIKHAEKLAMDLTGSAQCPPQHPQHGLSQPLNHPAGGSKSGFNVNVRSSDSGKGSGKPKSEEAQKKKPAEPKSYNIAHLKRAYNDYHDWNLAMQKKSHKAGQLRSIYILCTMSGSALSFLIHPIMSIICLLIGATFVVRSTFMMKKVAGPEERDRRHEEFQEQWRCPNPDCRKILPNVSYKVLRANYPSCPYCKSNFVE